jgi:hypothetical protein
MSLQIATEFDSMWVRRRGSSQRLLFEAFILQTPEVGMCLPVADLDFHRFHRISLLELIASGRDQVGCLSSHQGHSCAFGTLFWRHIEVAAQSCIDRRGRACLRQRFPFCERRNAIVHDVALEALEAGG